MARFYPLFSSSKGNSEFLGNPTEGILIDVGVSFKKLVTALNANDISISAVKGVFITHPHSDHVKGLKTLTAQTGIPVFGQYETLNELDENNLIDDRSKVYVLNDPATIAGMTVSCFDTPHDTVRSCGYRVTYEDGRTCAVCTDLGHITETVDKNILGCDLVMIESNYDHEMLKNGHYPYRIKERILSDNGHLSNCKCAEQVNKLVKNGTTRIILGHLSQDNNTPKIAEKTVLSKLSEFKRNVDYILNIAPVESSGEVMVF